MPHADKLLLLGTGFVGKAVIELAAGTRHIIASSRNPNRIFELQKLGVEPLIMPLTSPEVVENLAVDADLLVSFPPDGTTDALLAPACSRARSIVYVSSTGVYGQISGRIDDTTASDPNEQRMRPRLQAESIWREHGAFVIRAPGIYGPENGLHKRLRDGDFKFPSGGNLISRIHVSDLAGVILAIFDSPKKLSDRTYLIADQHPCSLKEVVEWLCGQMNLPLPESAPPQDLNPSLRGNRAIDGTRLLKELGFRLAYPTYKEGYRSCLDLV